MKLSDMFNISYGQHEYNSKRKLKKGKTPLISSQGADNGCYGFFNIQPKYKPPIITIPRTGSIGESFVQTFPCCVDDNCLVLEPLVKIDIETMFYISNLIREEKWRFKYGRQITPYRIGRLKVKGIKLKDKYLDIEKRLLPNSKVKLKLKEPKLKRIKIKNIFNVKKGEGKYFEKLKIGKTPLVSARSLNNGVIGYVNLNPTFKAPAITIERILGKTYPQLYDFSTVPDDIYVLMPIEKQQVEFLIYVANMMNYQSWRYNYSRKVTPYRLENMEIEIPIDYKGNIDLDYIKQLISNSYGSKKLLAKT